MWQTVCSFGRSSRPASSSVDAALGRWRVRLEDVVRSFETLANHSGWKAATHGSQSSDAFDSAGLRARGLRRGLAGRRRSGDASWPGASIASVSIDTSGDSPQLAIKVKTA
jgi:hypothetical protein